METKFRDAEGHLWQTKLHCGSHLEPQLTGGTLPTRISKAQKPNLLTLRLDLIIDVDLHRMQ